MMLSSGTFGTQLEQHNNLHYGKKSVMVGPLGRVRKLPAISTSMSFRSQRKALAAVHPPYPSTMPSSAVVTKEALHALEEAATRIEEVIEDAVQYVIEAEASENKGGY